VHIYRLGDSGQEVRDIQLRLVGLGASIAEDEVDGHFGVSTQAAVRQFQQRRSLRVDGLVGPDTWAQLIEAGYQLGDRSLYLHSPHIRGDDVRSLQRKLNALGFDAGREDGIFGSATDRAVREFQRNVRQDVDGIVGAHTIETLIRMRPLDEAPSRALVREREQLRGARGPISGEVIAIDPGHGPDSGGDLTLRMAAAVAKALGAVGAKPTIVRASDEDPSSQQRAAIANELGAAICVSLHLGSALPEASGPTCSYFGTTATYSPSGMHLAQLILDELEAEFRRRGRLQRLSIGLLRDTRMPAVQVEPLFATNEAEAREIAEPEFPARVGRAVAAGVQRFFAR
jgi:N-acetylmuramoyl-L-alanine amidase